MSKVAAYLRGHLAGEVDSRVDVRRAAAKDTGVLAAVPEMVIAPRSTNDIRKVARFSWQLAEKGHTLALTARGSGLGAMGGAVTKGAIVDLSRHMHAIFECDDKQKLVRLQPGVSIEALTSALSLRGTGLMALDGLNPRRTIGGAIAENAAGYLAGKYGDLSANVSQLEVVLANGDVLQTRKLTKREVSRKAGLQGLEGDIYRGIDAILEEFADEINTIHEADQTGYNAIARVRQKDGSIDLTPLFLGSQGTLGIISEMILRADFRSQHHDFAAIVFASADAARDAMDEISALKPSFLRYIDASLVSQAVQEGHVVPWFSLRDGLVPQVVILVGFDDFNARTRAKGCKRLERMFESAPGTSISFSDDKTFYNYKAMLDITRYTALPDKNELCSPPIYTDWFVPPARCEDFLNALADLASKLHVQLPVVIDGLRSTVSVYPQLGLGRTGDRQKLLRILDEAAKLVHEYNGALIGQQGEGRMAKFAYEPLSARRVELYTAIRKVFDPLGTLNPGVKQVSDVRTIASTLDQNLKI